MTAGLWHERSGTEWPLDVRSLGGGLYEVSMTAAATAALPLGVFTARTTASDAASGEVFRKRANYIFMGDDA
ncbi:hypothetical protein [Mangrovicoccus ximenensis]|uniref:hypothetical protein n=1 Tax=Mangrovicoccus ximenensis TaxID=1911570 RepID=UPI001374A663|nr:hypothetical protein [Mangrovicoccus ximenensis]